MDDLDERDLLERLSPLSDVTADMGQTQRILQLAHRAVVRRITLRWSAVAAMAALIAIVVVLGITNLAPHVASAAQKLQNAANATKDYRGYVHVTLVVQGNPLAARKFDPQSIHFNTADGTYGFVLKVYGTLLVEMFSPATHEEWMYTSASGIVLVSRLQDELAAAATKGAAEFPLKLADLLGQMKSRGIPAPQVVESVDQGLQRFDLTLNDDAKKKLDQYSEMPGGKLTLWVDPQTKLIRKMTARIDDQPVVMEYTYGAPEIHDIYDLGVPKTAQVVDNRQPPTSGKHPPVFDLPPTVLLVKDASIDLKALEARLKKRADGDWGDFVLLECNEINYVNGTMRSHSQGNLTIEAHQGVKAMYAIYIVSPYITLWGGQGFPKGWPMPKLADVVSQFKSVPPLNIDVFDSKNSWHGEPDNRLGTLQLKPTTQNSAPLHASFSPILWPSIQGFPSKTFKVEILRDPARPSLIVLHTDASSPSPMNKGKSAYHYETMYWLDPAHDDLPVETVIRSNFSDAGNHEDTMHFVYLDFGHLADGRWYPSHWQIYNFGPPTTQPAQLGDDGYSEYWRQILTDEKLGPEWYGDPSLRITGKGMHLPWAEPATKPASKPARARR